MPEFTTVRLARQAMATRFEIVLRGENAVHLRAAGEAALEEIERLEQHLSLYRSTSEIARLNARGHREPVRLSPGTFRLLRHAQQLARDTGGAFDVTVGPLMRCWGFLGGHGHQPARDEFEAARRKVGMHLVQLDSDNLTARFAEEGMIVDLGAIGKGYAIDQAAELLQEAEVAHVLIHGGTSTVLAFGEQAPGVPWRVAIEMPPAQPENSPVPIAFVPLNNASLSVSSVWGKGFAAGESWLGHVMDPRTGSPVANAVLAAVVTESAAESDALSTALLTAGPEGLDAIAALRPGLRALVIQRESTGWCWKSSGICPVPDWVSKGRRLNR